ncbi:hypothetical protein BV898_05464 [Hypsibius exemplaris]|uniref:Uncharacterized protein n=1 Tax=Hypsibius exemplaris TaxID=2072580 RepID=A0A1W0WZK5_HYPEX|nr:hypothetical protein BV898_05464 [Hypsibius exemplaris]
MCTAVDGSGGSTNCSCNCPMILDRIWSYRDPLPESEAWSIEQAIKASCPNKGYGGSTTTTATTRDTAKDGDGPEDNNPQS